MIIMSFLSNELNWLDKFNIIVVFDLFFVIKAKIALSYNTQQNKLKQTILT